MSHRSRRLLLVFEHLPCEVAVDIHLPLPDPIRESTEALAERVCPSCPICKQPMRYVGWNFSDAEQDVQRAADAEIPPKSGQ